MKITYTTLMIHNWPQPALNNCKSRLIMKSQEDCGDEKILKLLFNHFESEEEGVSNVETERKIALIEPEKLVTALKGLM
ncbi:hypothetical protein ACB092_11G016400 [Castanea dentata]